MTGVIWELLILQILTIILLLFVMLKLLQARKVINYEKRISPFCNQTVNSEQISVFDSLTLYLSKYVKMFSNKLKKSVLINRYAQKYEKHISYENRKYMDPIDFISLKTFISLTLVFLNILTYLFQYTRINLMWLLLTFVIGFFLLDIFLHFQYKRHRAEIENDLLKAVIIMNNAFKSGRNIMQAVEIVKNELTGAIQDEFKKIYMDITYGLTIEVVFNRFYERVQLEDAKYITASLSLLNKTGGNITKVFSSIEKNFFNKKRLREELKTMTSSSNFVFRVLILMPIVLIGVILVLSPTYFKPLYATTIGCFLLFIATLLYISYIFVIKMILKVDIS